MEDKSFYDSIVIDHNLHPGNKHDIEGANIELEGVNPSCGDDIVLKLKVEGGIIVDGGFSGEGCAISQSSCDVMLDLIIGKTVEEAKHLSELFLKMIREKPTEEELEELEEAGAFKDISHMPARVKCAVLGWRTMAEALSGSENAVTTEHE